MSDTTTQPTLFSLLRGDDTAFTVRITDQDGEPMDITGWHFKATMKMNPMCDDASAGVRVNIDALDDSMAAIGVFSLLLPHEQTELLLPALYYFDLQRELDGLVTTVLHGRVRVIADVTRRTA